jgi:hypothetical protein
MESVADRISRHAGQKYPATAGSNYTAVAKFMTPAMHQAQPSVHVGVIGYREGGSSA